MSKKDRQKEKELFLAALTDFVKGLDGYVSAKDGQWTVKGFIDIFKNIYTISSDTKIVSKILEIHTFFQGFFNLPKTMAIPSSWLSTRTGIRTSVL
jgi:hypothetical protein